MIKLLTPDPYKVIALLKDKLLFWRVVAIGLLIIVLILCLL